MSDSTAHSFFSFAITTETVILIHLFCSKLPMEVIHFLYWSLQTSSLVGIHGMICNFSHLFSTSHRGLMSSAWVLTTLLMLSCLDERGNMFPPA